MRTPASRLFGIGLLTQLIAGLAFFSFAVQAQGPPLHVCATVPELGDLARTVGGDRVSVVVFTKGTEDPSTVAPTPGFFKALLQADLYLQAGLGLETGWAPQLLKSAGNRRILPGAPGYLDASQVVSASASAMSVAARPLASSVAYLLDPLNGLRVAGLISAKLSELQPEQREYFNDNYRVFARKLASHLLGEDLARIYGDGDIERLAALFEHDTLGGFLQARGQLSLLGGWFGEMYPHYGDIAVADSDAWGYFARRFGIKIVGEIQPNPGIEPTTRHLRELVTLMREADIKLAIVSSYYDPRTASFLAEQTGAQIIRLAPRVGAAPQARDYLSLLDYDVQQFAAHGTHPPRPGRFEIHRHEGTEPP